MATSLAELSNIRSRELYEEFSGIEFRDVWRKNDAQAEADAVAMWQRMGILPQGIDPYARAKELAVVAYENGRLVAITTVTIDILQVVRTKMAFFRALVDDQHRAQKVLVPLTYALHQAMERYAQAHPELKIGGTAAVVVAPNTIYKPVGSAEMILIGYTNRNEPVLVRWFDGYRF
ncbi:MAG TPA: hypothetical protein VIM56_00775 [Rhizomicrobium sp.]